MDGAPMDCAEGWKEQLQVPPLPFTSFRVSRNDRAVLIRNYRAKGDVEISVRNTKAARSDLSGGAAYFFKASRFGEINCKAPRKYFRAISDVVDPNASV